MRYLIYSLLLFFSVLSMNCQELTQTNTDSLLYKGLELYRAGEFRSSLRFADRGLDLAPGYHDIRLLRVRNLQALGELDRAEEDLLYLADHALHYPGVERIVNRQANLYSSSQSAIDYLERIRNYNKKDRSLLLMLARRYLEAGRSKEAEKTARLVASQSGLNGSERYQLNRIFNRTIKNSVGADYRMVHFSEEYPSRDTWNFYALEYRRLVNRTAVLGRLHYSSRGDTDGWLYEIEAYPVINEKMYFFTNVGFSAGELFPDVRASASVFFNFLQGLELESGARYFRFSNNDHLVSILGLGFYAGNFYVNGRAAIGPRNAGKLTQNYQVNARYYFRGRDNYMFTRVSRGISPDETAIYMQVQEDPFLEANYISGGVHFSIRYQHVIRVEGGLLTEELSAARTGKQFLPSLGYRFRF